MKTLTIIAATLLIGCGMKNEDIVREIKYCLENGLEPYQRINALTYETVRIECRLPKRSAP
jgi:hypothetical protein